MSVSRQCSRAACPRPAARTLTYVYSDSTVVLGPLATYAEPHAYDLCDDHAARLLATVPLDEQLDVLPRQDVPVHERDRDVRDRPDG